MKKLHIRVQVSCRPGTKVGRDDSMIITHKLTMDLGRFEKTPLIDAVQDDRYSRNVELTLLERGSAWTVPAEARVVIAYRKADNVGGQYDTLPDGTTAWSAAENVLTLALAPQVLTAAGMVSLSVQLVLDEQTISTFRLLIHVHRNVAAGLYRSEDYVNLQQWCLPIFEQKVSTSGWTPGMYLGTDDQGNVVTRPGSDVVPAVTAADDGKFLQVSGGVWIAERLPYAEEKEY